MSKNNPNQFNQSTNNNYINLDQPDSEINPHNLMTLSDNEDNDEQANNPIQGGQFQLNKNEDFNIDSVMQNEGNNQQYQQNEQGLQDKLISDLIEPSNTKSVKTKNFKKQKQEVTLEEQLIQITQKIGEKSSVQNKISGLKRVCQRIRQSKFAKANIQMLCNWIEATNLVENYLNQDAHPHLLKNMATIVKLLYENHRLNLQWVYNFVDIGLKTSHEQYLKVVQALLSVVQIEQLCLVYQQISNHHDLQNHNIASLLSTIVTNKYFLQQQKKIAPPNQPTSKKQKEPVSAFLQELDRQNDFFDLPNEKQFDEQKQQIQPFKEKQNTITRQLALNLFKFLIDATVVDANMGAYYPILNKLITSKYQAISNQLSIVMPELLKNGNINGVWILEQCLKIDFGQNSKQKNNKNQTKSSFILKLVNQHLYQYLLIILTKVRFNKVVVDKILNIIILLSKNYKPLDENYTRYIWTILGLHSRQQKQREQFFNFVKDILRNQSNFTEESVHFIFFQVLMSLTADWFSLKILDCLQMLFMRLNEDLKLISYADQTYSIQDPDLIGIDKFWYIYFYSNDSKVNKKCKDFLWKLTTYNSNSQTKTKLLNQFVNKIILHMCQASGQLKIDFTNKGFEIIDKMMEQVQKKQVNTAKQIEINVMNECEGALLPKKIPLRLSQKYTLSALKQLISQSITPNNKNIKLMCKGQILKCVNMNLKNLGIQNKNTIIVIDDLPTMKQNNNQSVQKIANQIIDIFGAEINHELLKYIAIKMEGQNLQHVTDVIMNPQKLANMTIDFQNQRLTKQQQVKILTPLQKAQSKPEPQKQQQKQPQPEAPQVIKFSTVLTSNQQYIKQLLFCAGQGNKKRGWSTIKNLPNCLVYLSETVRKCQESSWETLFPREEACEMTCIYNAHMLKHILAADQSKINSLMLQRGGFEYLIDWLRRLTHASSYIVIEEFTNLLVIVLQLYCEALVKFRYRIIKKNQCEQLSAMIQENSNSQKMKESQFVKYGDQSFFNWLINLLLSVDKSNHGNSFPSQNIAQLLIYFILSSEQRMMSVLSLATPQIFHIITTHGFMGQYIFLTAVSKLLCSPSHSVNPHPAPIQTTPASLPYLHNLFCLSELSYKFIDPQQDNKSIVYVYDFLSCLLDYIGKYEGIGEKEMAVVSKFIDGLMGLSQAICDDNFIAMLNFVKLGLRVYKDNNNFNQEQKQQIQGKIIKFSQWLFKNFLFDLQKPSKHIRNKTVRKVCYQILQIISHDDLKNAKKLIDEIVKIQIKDRHKEDDYVDFRSQQYIGLTNLGATCYINSLMQQIYHTRFSKLLLQKGDLFPQQAQKMKQLKQIFMQLCFSIKNVVNPRQFIRNFSFYGTPINTSVQQDATQFLFCLFDHFEGEGCREEVHNVFGGYLQNQITVLEDDAITETGIVKQSLEHFNSLTLDIKGKKNLHQAMAFFIKPQMLDGQNKYNCQQLGKKMKARKKCLIQKMPNILILSLKRFQYDFDSHTRHKLNDYFQFPLQLDLHKYSVSHIKNKEQSSDSKYKLAGILVHSGSAESGHYYSYIKIGEQWYQFNDRSVSEFNIGNNLKNQCFGCPDGKKTRSAYMLFYEKAQTQYHGVYLSQIANHNIYRKNINDQNAIFLKNRLIYDDNFRKMLQMLYKQTKDQSVQKFIQKIFGTKQQMKMIEQVKDSRKQGQSMIHFDADQNVPLMQNEDFDQINGYFN